MTSENVSEPETVEPLKAVPAKAVDERLIEEPIGRARAEGLKSTDEGGLQRLTKRGLPRPCPPRNGTCGRC